MAPQTHDLYVRIAELRGEALDVLTQATRGQLDLSFDEAGGLVQALQQVSNRLGFAAALLAERPLAVAA